MLEPAAPHPLGGGGQRVLLEVRAAQRVDFWENFKKQKLKNTPDVVGAGQVRSLTAPRCPAGGLIARRRPQAWSLGCLS